MKELIARMARRWHNSCSQHAVSMQKMHAKMIQIKQKEISLIGAKRAKKEPNEKLVLAKNGRELRLDCISCYYDAKNASPFTQGECKV
jgi:predicted dithiol-disulfide oxidoreductase (DUF899 family)